LLKKMSIVILDHSNELWQFLLEVEWLVLSYMANWRIIIRSCFTFFVIILILVLSCWDLIWWEILSRSASPVSSGSSLISDCRRKHVWEIADLWQVWIMIII
jgi:hypothetical protein